MLTIRRALVLAATDHPMLTTRGALVGWLGLPEHLADWVLGVAREA